MWHARKVLYNVWTKPTVRISESTLSDTHLAILQVNR
jgi:hypothetical protein